MCFTHLRILISEHLRSTLWSGMHNISMGTLLKAAMILIGCTKKRQCSQIICSLHFFGYLCNTDDQNKNKMFEKNGVLCLPRSRPVEGLEHLELGQPKISTQQRPN